MKVLRVRERNIDWWEYHGKRYSLKAEHMAKRFKKNNYTHVLCVTNNKLFKGSYYVSSLGKVCVNLIEEI